MSSDEEIQQYLDAINDRSVFCDGFLLTLIPTPESPRMSPNCQQRNNCRLFRTPSSRQIKPWLGKGTAEDGCFPFKLWQIEKRQQDEDSREWIVNMAGQTKTICGRDAQAAAVNMFLSLRDSGIDIDPSVLIEQSYTVREK